MTEEAVKPHTYYSPHGRMSMTVNHGKLQLGPDGASRRMGWKIVEFMPQADNWGRFVTDDPEVIAYMERKIAEGSPDIVRPAEYTEKTTPDHIRAREAKVALERTLTENNRLLEKIRELEKRQGK